METQNTRQFLLKSVTLSSVDNQSINITPLVIEFSIFESINNPYMLGSLLVEDSSNNILSNLPIQGRERVVIVVSTPAISAQEYTFDLTVSGINSRTIAGRQQVYDLMLMSYAGMQNEGIRIGKTLEGKPEEIVSSILSKYLKVKKGLNSSPSAFRQKYLPSLKRPFDFIYQLARITVSSWEKSNAAKSLGDAPASSETPESDITGKDAKRLKGTAGYLFYETYDNYNFRSLNDLMKQKSKYTYTYGMANDGVSDGKNALKILDYAFRDEFDMLKQLRSGVYSTMYVSFDVTTNSYEERLYKFEDSFKEMEHLGKTASISKGAKELSQYPTRIMTQMTNNEMFHDQRETPGKVNAKFKDTYLYANAQSNARYHFASNQQLNITVPPNLSIRAGDLLTLKFPNMVNQTGREQKPYDEEHSGKYLVKNIGYNFIVRGANPYTATTVIDAIKDTPGWLISKAK
jgi:hypothetical protein